MKISYLLLLCMLAATVSAHAELLTLQECLGTAATSNPALKVAAYDKKIAADNITLAKSGYLPRLDFQAGYTAQLDPQSININDRSIPTQEADYGFFSLTIYQTLYDFGRNDARTQRATSAREATVREYDGREKDTFLQVVEAYYGILTAQKLLTAANEEIVQRADHLRNAQNLFSQGVVTRNDVLQAEVKLADSRQRQLTMANKVENSWLYLNFLTGQAPERRGELEEKSSSELALPVFQSFADALDKRPEIAALKSQLQVAEAEVKESRAGYYPEIFLKLGVDYVQNDKVQEQAIMAATIGLKVNLYDGLATTSRQKQAVDARSRNRERLRQTEAQIGLELRTAINDAKVSSERIKTVEQSIKQGEENLRINRDRYLAQVGTATDVIDAQTLLTQTRTDYYRAVYEYQVAIARVKKALGEL